MEPAYYAGLFDGEGCVRINRGRGRASYLRVSVVNSHRGVLTNLQSRFGGSLLPHNKPQPTHKQTWTWAAASIKAETFLQTILPHLVVKRAEALIGLNFLAARNKNARRITDTELALREGFMEQLREAKHGTRQN